MMFMVIERIRDADPLPAYRHLREAGRGLPEGLRFLGSWVEPNGARCFQLMECTDAGRLAEWALHWRGTGVQFEIVPVIPGREMQEIVEQIEG